MNFSRRDFLRRGALAVPASLLAPGAFIKSVLAAPAGVTKNLILVEMFGGNDGLNTIVPWNFPAYYSEFRPTIGVPDASVLKVLNQPVGFNPGLASLKSHFDQGRVAVVQGVSYPNPSFSHEYAQRIWHTGSVTTSTDGWLARYLNLFPTPTSPVAGEVLDNLTALTSGTTGFVPAFTSIDDLAFPYDDYNPDDATNRKTAFNAIVNALAAGSGSVNKIAENSRGLSQLIDTFQQIPDVNFVGQYPDDYFSDLLKSIVRVMNANIGMRFFHVGLDGFDTHSEQNTDDYHSDRLKTMADGLSALYDDLNALGMMQDTLVVVFSEFGRTVYENGSVGTDHGTVLPVLVFGGSGVNGGFVNSHPPVDPSQLDPVWNELQMQADFRDVFGTVLKRWLGLTPAEVQTLFLGYNATDLGFLV